MTIAQVLKNSGYHTYMAGKWHVARSEDTSDMHNWPLQRGFDRFFGTIKGGGNYFDPNGLLMGNRFVETDKDFYYTDAISRQAAGYLRQYASNKDDHPFFMYVAFTAPHWPLHAPDSSIEKYQGRFDAGWDQLRKSRLSRLREMGIIDAGWKLSGRDPRIPAWKEAKNKNWHKRRMEVYAAQIDQMDQGIGRIVNTLEEGDELDNTLILFLSDNGACAEDQMFGFDCFQNGEPPGGANSYMSYGRVWANACNTPFRKFKRWDHEGGIRTPFIAHWPNGITNPGQVTDQAGHVIDFMATFLDIAGVAYPETFNAKEIRPLRGKSLLPILQGGQRKGHETLYWEHIGNRAMRSGDWKLVAAADGPWELYDMASDVTELNNLAASCPERMRALVTAYEAWAKEVGV